MHRFSDFKNGIQQITTDPQWIAKILLTGFLLINPFLVALAPNYFSSNTKEWVRTVFPWIVAFNILSFCFPLGFTFEVLRRSRTAQGSQLPEWRLDLLGRYGYEGLVKFCLACSTLLLPVGIWFALVYGLFIWAFGLSPATISLFVGPIMWLGIPFCSVACCRWIDGIPAWNCALNYQENWCIFRKGLPDYLIASAILMGVGTVANGLFYTIPIAVIFGLCLADLWFGPIYAEIMDAKDSPVKKRH